MFQSAYGQQSCKGHCDSMLGSLSSLGELVKLFIILFSEDTTQNKLGLTQVFCLGNVVSTIIHEQPMLMSTKVVWNIDCTVMLNLLFWQFFMKIS